ncbi:hypothetical protein [Dactylosporangium cerinum]
MTPFADGVVETSDSVTPSGREKLRLNELELDELDENVAPPPSCATRCSCHRRP